MPGVIIPRKAVLELTKLVENAEALVEVALSSAKIRFALDGVVLTSKLIDGTFPDYERVIPRHNDKVMEVDTKLFSQAVDRVSTISSEKGRAVKLNIGEDRLVLSVNNPDSGSAEEELAVSYRSEPIDIGFNSRYLLDIAGQLKGDSAAFQFADSGFADDHPGYDRRALRCLSSCRCGYDAMARLMVPSPLGQRGPTPYIVE
jgi:DNA polymerase III subunit beta